MRKNKSIEPESSAVFSGTKLKGLAYLMNNFNRHSSNPEAEQEAWTGVSLILEDLGEDLYSIADALQEQRRTSKLNA